MNKILEISNVNMTATVQPGVVLGDLKKEVDSCSLFFPPDPSNYRVSTVGGAIAQSSAGALSFKYGTIKDYILSLKIVTADGKLLTLGAGTLKDSSGYHLNQLIVGSEGTLGIVVEATLKLIPKPEAKRVMLAYYNSTEQAIESLNEVLKNNIYPSAVDFMDKNSILTVEDFTKYGFDTTAECMLIIEFDGFKDSILSQLEKTKKIIEYYSGKTYYAIAEEDAEKLWQARHSSFSAASRLAPDVISDDIIVPRQNLILLIKGCNEICLKYGIKLCLVGHVGDGNIHPQMVLDLENEDEYRNLQMAKSELYKLANDLGGTISAEHGVGYEKMRYLENILDNDTLEYMKLIKKTFDPKNILNPGKIFKL